MISGGAVKKRYLYSILFGVPGFFISLIILSVIFAIAAGILWLYFFGDDPWPSSIETMLPILFFLGFLGMWVTLIMVGYRTGKKLENDPQLNRIHIMVSAGLTFLFILFIALQQLRVGNIGPKSDELVCSDYCSLQGHSGSGMPPKNSGQRICSCFDDSGNEAIKIPIESIDPDGSD
jgi:hypothetical protein